MQSQSSDSNFNLPRNARLGVLVLLVILIILVFVWKMLPSWIQPKADKEEAALQQSWSAFKRENIKASPEQKSHDHSKPEHEDTEDDEEPEVTVTLFPFNPNTATEAELLRLGLPKYTVNTILKYRAKSTTTFKRKEDLQKLYTLSKEDYARIAPYVQIPESASNGGYVKATFVKEATAAQTIELNVATAEQLMSLNGIGTGYSKRILNFRDALGGFISVDQLKEVYGLPDSTFQQLKDKFTVNVTLVKQINVNIADEATLAKMPYIGRKMAPNIIKLRKDMGSFKEMEQLRQVPLINEEKYRKIAPYLSTH